MRLVICDDNPGDLEMLRRLCAEYGEARGLDFDIVCCRGAEEYLERRKEGEADVLLLDIYMDGMDGIALAATLRAEGFAGAIVIVSSSDEYYPEGFEVEATHYLLKPVQKEQLFTALGRACRGWQKAERRISVISGRRRRSIPVGHIIYIEVYGHQTRLVTTAGIVPLALPLAEAQQLVGDEGFLRCFRSYVVNMDHIRGIGEDAFIMSNGDAVRITRREMAAIEDRYMDYLFRRGENGAR